MKKREKDIIESKSTISQDTKSEIQELFDDLFLRQLTANMRQVDEKTEANATEIGCVKKQEQKHFLVLSDSLEKIVARINCLGNGDDWGEIVLPEAINIILDQISEEAKILMSKTDCLCGDWEDNNLLQRLCNISDSLSALSVLIESIRKQSEEQSGSNFNKIYNQLKQIDGIIGKLSIIENGIEKIEVKADAQQRQNELISSQVKLNDLLSSCLEKLNTVQESCNSINNALIDIEKRYIQLMQTQGEEILRRIDAYELSNKETISHLENIILNITNQSKKRLLFAYLGIGAISTLNIVTIVLLLVR